MNISTTDLQALVGPQLSALADLLDERARSSERPDTIADAETLCAGWSVRHVVAHMTMAARYDGPAFKAARELIVKGGTEPSGYTEPLLHHWRRVAKAS